MQPLYMRHGNRYRAAANAEILDAAAAIVIAQTRGAMLSSPQEAARLCRSMCAGYDNERFGVVWLDSRHRVIHAETLFAVTADVILTPERRSKSDPLLGEDAVHLGRGDVDSGAGSGSQGFGPPRREPPTPIRPVI